MHVCSIQHVSAFSVAFMMPVLTFIAYDFICMTYALMRSHVRVRLPSPCGCSIHRNHTRYTLSLCRTCIHLHVSLYTCTCIPLTQHVHHARTVYARMHIQGVSAYVWVLSSHPLPTTHDSFRVVYIADVVIYSAFVCMSLSCIYHMHMWVCVSVCIGVWRSCDSLFTYRHALYLHTVAECECGLATARYVHSQLMYACIVCMYPCT
jgi:hypothetical protein